MRGPLDLKKREKLVQILIHLEFIDIFSKGQRYVPSKIAIFLVHKIPVNANNCATRKRFRISLLEHHKDDHA